MSFNKNVSSVYAIADHKMGRVGTAVAGAAVGGAAGAGVGLLAKANPLVSAGIGAAAGLMTEEAGRLFVDEEVYQLKRLELNLEETVKVAARYF